jgi:hypothetical protein
VTVQTEENRANYVADGILASFAFNFETNDAAWINTYEEGVLTTKNIEVVLNANQDTTPGGVVNFLDPAPAGIPVNLAKVTIERIADLTQGIDYNSYDDFPADTHEAGLDKLTYQNQQLSDAIDRAIKADVTVPAGTSYTLPVPNAGSFLQWNVDENGFINVHISDLGDKAVARNSLDVYSKAESNALDTSYPNIPARNSLLTKDPLSQAGSSTPGFSAVLGVADDGITGTQYLRWQKDRNNVENWYMSDSVRGDFYLSSNLTAAEVATVPAINADDVSFQWDLISTITGVTNRNKPYTAHYNPYLGVSVVGYEGDGVNEHEIPHHLGVVPELIIFKDRDAVSDWITQSPLFNLGEYLVLNTSAAVAGPVTWAQNIFSNSTVSLDDGSHFNTSANNIVMQCFASVAGVSKIGKYIGTGAAGNYVECGFKPAFVLVKNLTGAGSWILHDAMRIDNDLYLDQNISQGTTDRIDMINDGFVNKTNYSHLNTTNSEYLFIAFAESSIDASKAVANYTLPTNADQLAIANPALMTFANGFDQYGQVDVQEQIAGATLTYGAGHEDKKYYIYRDEGSAWGQSEVRPLVGLTRDTADYSGVVSPSDSALRTTAHHFDYESETGVVLASGEVGGTYFSYNVFNKDSNDIMTAAANALWLVASTTTSWVQYKHTEKRILKSWRMRAGDTVARSPRRFTIEGSNDGLNWTAIDSTYTASDYTSNGVSLWGDLHLTTANTTAYLYHRIDITVNDGDATYTQIGELELNTKIASDYYLVDEAKMYNDAGTRLDRVYIGEALLDSGGDVISFINYAAGKQQLNEIEIHGELKVHGGILSNQVFDAWCVVDTTKSPQLILAEKNVADVVDIGAGYATPIYKEAMDFDVYHVDCTALDDKFASVTSQALMTKQSCQISIVNSAGARVDSILFFGITGGKKIL